MQQRITLDTRRNTQLRMTIRTGDMNNKTVISQTDRLQSEYFTLDRAI